MIWTIAKREFLSNLMTFKFAVCTAICLILVVLFTWVLVDDYQRRLEAYNDAVRKSEEELKEARVYSEIRPTVYKPPEVLSIFNEGVEKRLGNSVTIELGKVPEIQAGYTAGNPLLAVFPTLDLTLIFKLVLSILALLLVYDVISGEKERGTLKLMLSGTVPRHQVLLGKLVAGLLTLAIPIAVSFLAVLLILEFSPMVSLTGSDWVRIGLIFLVSLIFTAAMFNFGLFFSCLTKKSATTLIYLSFFWVLFVVVIPNASIYLATQLRSIKPREGIDLKVREIWDEFERKRSEYALKNQPQPSIVSEMDGVVLNAPRDLMRYTQKENAIFEPLRIKYATKAWKLEQEYFDSLIKQKRLGDYLSLISPISIYERVMSGLSETDLSTYERFMEKTRTYRDEIIDYFNSKKLFSSLAFFTVQKEKDLIDAKGEDFFVLQLIQMGGKLPPAQMFQQLPEPQRVRMLKMLRKVEQKMRRWQTKPHLRPEELLDPETLRFMNLLNEYREKGVTPKNFPALDLRDFPRFSYKPESVPESVERTLPDLALLIFVNVMFFLLAFRVFLRYDAG